MSMEYNYPSSLFSFLGILSSSLFVFIFHKVWNSRASKLPPGTMGFPIIGEMKDYSSSGPEKFIQKRMEKYPGGVFKTSLLGEKMAVFCGPEGNKFMFTNENNSLTTWWPEAFMSPLTFDLPKGTTLKESMHKTRGFLHEFFRSESLKRCVPVMDWMSRKHLELEWAPRQEVKVYPLCKKITFSLACKLFLGIQDSELVDILCGYFDLMESLMLSLPVNLPGTAYRKAIRVGNIVKAEIIKTIMQRKNEGDCDGERVDFLSHVLFHSKHSINNERELCNMLTSVILATYDDTSAAITFVLKFLAEFPHVYAQVYRECIEIASCKDSAEATLNWNDLQKMKYSWNVARETLRLIPPSPGTYREVTADLTFSGVTVPKGWKTFWSVYSTHKDSRYFLDAEKFDPLRFEGSGPAPYTFVPFGGGSRMCPGREYARMQILVFMYNVVRRFKLEKLDPNENLKYHITPFPENGLPLRLIPHEAY